MLKPQPKKMLLCLACLSPVLQVEPIKYSQSEHLNVFQKRPTLVAQLSGCILYAGIVISDLYVLHIHKTDTQAHTCMYMHTLGINKMQTHTPWPQAII